VASSLDVIGQRDETLRQRIGEMQERLEDLKALAGDFSAIIMPIGDITAELPRATARIIELEGGLAQARQAITELRLENVAFADRSESLSRDLAFVQARAESTARELGAHQAELEEARVLLRDRELTIESLERRLFAESEQAKALTGENKALRQEVQTADSALSRSEHELGAIRERASLLESDNERLQQLAAELTSQVAGLQGRLQEVEAALEIQVQQKLGLEEKLVLEVAARERAEGQLEVETNAFRTEKATFAMKLDAVRHRSSTSEQILARLRLQLREQEQAARAAERNLKEAVIARTSADRRLESLQEDMARQSERFLELQRLRDEFAARCEMLSKAISAKDVQVTQAATRVSGLEDRIEQLAAKHETVRRELEAANRRLAEELEGEKSERALLQGALEIARDSRIQLKKRYEALKRAGRGPSKDETHPETEAETANNVHTLVTGKGQPH
jgi:crescentin